jgi:DNA-binding IclR family transcriptional regulator
MDMMAQGAVEDREKRATAGGIRSVVLAFRVLGFLTDSGSERGVTEIAQALDLTKASVYRHLRTLMTLGYIDQNAKTAKYHVGMGLYLLGRAAGEQIDFLAEAKRVMERLRDDTGHTVTLGQPVEDGVLIVELMRANTPFEIGTRPGYIFPYHATAQGKLALAFGPVARLEKVLAGPLEKLTDRTITEPVELRSQVVLARRRGWAVAPGETLPGITALAAPVFDHDGELAVTITVIGSVQHIGVEPAASLIDDVVRAAGQVSRALGYREVTV